MPQFPRYESQKSLTTKPLAPVKPVAGQREQAVSNILQTAQDITVKWANAKDTMQYTTAKSTFEVGLADIQKRAALDPEIGNAGVYYGEIEKLRKTSLEGFMNKALQQRTDLEFGFGAQMAGIEIDNLYRKKLLINNAFELNRGVEALVEKMVSGPNPEQTRQELVALVNYNVANGTIPSEEGQKLINDALHSAVKYDIYDDASTEEGRSVVLAELKAGKKGKYNYLTADERLKLIGESQRRIAQNVQNLKAMTKEQRLDSLHGLVNKISEGTLTLKDIENARKIPHDQGGINPTTLNQFQKGLVKGYVDDIEAVASTEQRAADYYNLITDFMDDKTDREKAYEYLAKAYADQYLNKEERQVLGSIANSMADISFARRKFSIFNGVRHIAAFFRANLITDAEGKPVTEEKDIALAVKRYLTEIGKGKEPEAIEKDLISEEVAKMLNINWAEIPQEGKRFINIEGRSILIKPDRTYTEID